MRDSIIMSEQKNFKEEDLVDLFHSVGWDEYSANHPVRLVECMRNSDSVFSCWDGNKLIGLLSVLSDSFHVFPMYLLVHKDYQCQGIGSALFRRFDSKYNNHYKMFVSESAVDYYPRFGYEPCQGVAYFEKFDVKSSDTISPMERYLNSHNGNRGSRYS